MCHAAIPYMQQQKTSSIINLGDACAELQADILSYQIGKHSVLLLTKGFAQEYAKDGIRVNCVSPGILENSVTKAPRVMIVENSELIEFVS